MNTIPGFLRLNRLRIMQREHIAYENLFHEGINIIRGENGSGKSTIADCIFFILGGEFNEWKDAAGKCDEVQAEIETPHGKLSLRRRINGSQEPIFVYFGPISNAPKNSSDSWYKFPIHRQHGRESFSQVIFRSLNIPEANSEGSSNITMHQLLRLCYSDQRTPASRLFRLEPFDTQNIRNAVGELICGINSFEAYEIDLKLRESKKQLTKITTQSEGLHSALSIDQTLNTRELILAEISKLENERSRLQYQVKNVDKYVNSGEVKDFLNKRREAQDLLTKQRNKLRDEEKEERKFEYELREIGEYLDFLEELMEKLTYAEATCSAIGSIDFTHCPACGETLNLDTPKHHCVVCNSPLDPDKEKSHYNQIRLDLEIQTRESGQLLHQKANELDTIRTILRKLRSKHKTDLSEFDLLYGGGNSPREEFLATKTLRIGHIDSSIEFLHRSLDIAEKISTLAIEKSTLIKNIESLDKRKEALKHEERNRRIEVLSEISKLGKEILRLDLLRQSEFENAKNVDINFHHDTVSVDGMLNFAESSNVILKNSAVLSIFLSACSDQRFYHPRFLLIDNIEDKGMEELRSHRFQEIIVNQALKLNSPYQIIFTTSMMNPDLDKEEFTIGPQYTSNNRVLKLKN